MKLLIISDISVTQALRKLPNLKRLVVLVTFTKQSIHAIMELMHPADDVLGNPFIPQRCCLIDTLPESTSFELAMLMERRFMRRITPNKDVEEIPPPKTDADYKRAINPLYNMSEVDLREQIVQKRTLAEKEMYTNKRKKFGHTRYL